MMRWLIIFSLLIITGCARDKYLAQQKELEELRKTNTLEAYDTFLAKHPDSDWKKTTLYYRDQLWIETAGENRDSASLIEFLQERPDSIWVEKARYYQQKIKLDKTRQLNTIEAYDTFLTEHPDSAHRKNLVFERDKLWVTQAIANKNKAQLIDFIRRYPDSKWTEQAHFHISHRFKVAEPEEVANCSKCHQDGFLQ